jgi:hypothetical protein
VREYRLFVERVVYPAIYFTERRADLGNGSDFLGDGVVSAVTWYAVVPGMITEVDGTHVAWEITVHDRTTSLVLPEQTSSALSTDRPYQTSTLVRGTPEQGWEAILGTRDKVPYWNDVFIESEWTRGATLTMKPRRGCSAVDVGTVVEHEPLRRLSFHLQAANGPPCPESLVTFTMAKEKEGVRLTLTSEHRRHPQNPWPIQKAWTGILSSLRRQVEEARCQTGEARRCDRESAA